MATSIGGILDNGMDANLYVDDLLHVNTSGSIKMYERLCNDLGFDIK